MTVFRYKHVRNCITQSIISRIRPRSMGNFSQLLQLTIITSHKQCAC